jgi:hypothetical protein
MLLTNFKKICLLALSMATAIAYTPMSSAEVLTYAQDFEDLDASNPDALGRNGDQWQVWADVWDGDVGTGTFLYSYGPFTAPNSAALGSDAFSAIATGEGGAAQGSQYLNIFSDYQNFDHGIGLNINTSVFQEYTIDSGDIGQEWTLTFDAKSPLANGIADATNATASAFIKTLDPNNGYWATNDIRVDMTNISNTEWTRYSISLDLSDPLLNGQILQFGFNTTATNYDNSGVYYDRICFDITGGDCAPLVNVTFEADDASGGDVPGATGWTTFESVFTNSTIGPNSGPVSHDAGGTQSLKMFGPFFFDGASGAYQADDSVEAGKTYTATAHAMNWAPDALSPGNLGIFQLSFWDAAGGQDGGGNNLGTTQLIVDSTDDSVNIYLPGQDGADISDWTELSITEIAPVGAVSAEIFLLHIQLNDPVVGGSIFWDDVNLVVAPDTDDDGVPDVRDNCILVPNPLQRDTDSDNFGNFCDADFDNNLLVNAADLAIFKPLFFSTDPDADLNGNGTVNAADLAILKTMFFKPPGPSCCAP